MSALLEIKELPPRLFVIGDIHGCAYEVKKLVEYIDRREKIKPEEWLVFVGDYIDRGPASKEVIDFMLEVRRNHPNSFFLKGNHEDMLLSFMGLEGNLGQGFIHNGGLATLLSYGLSLVGSSERLVELFPKDHLDFLQNLIGYMVIGDYVIAHAGLNPLRELNDQVPEELYWIRDEFLRNRHYFEKTVIFGHTPHTEVLFDLPYKIGIDTGLVYGNKLSCYEVITSKIIQIKRDGKRVRVSNAKSRLKQRRLFGRPRAQKSPPPLISGID